jgi:hypothetical protein
MDSKQISAVVLVGNERPPCGEASLVRDVERRRALLHSVRQFKLIGLKQKRRSTNKSPLMTTSGRDGGGGKIDATPRRLPADDKARFPACNTDESLGSPRMDVSPREKGETGELFGVGGDLLPDLIQRSALDWLSGRVVETFCANVITQ